MEAGTPQPERQQPSPPGSPANEKEPSRRWRALGVLFALALVFASVVVVLQMIDVGGNPRCDDPAAIDRERQETGEQVVQCFDGSRAQKAATLALGWPGAGIAAIAALVALLFAATGRHDRLMLRLTGAAIVLGGLSIVIGAI